MGQSFRICVSWTSDFAHTCLPSGSFCTVLLSNFPVVQDARWQQVMNKRTAFFYYTLLQIHQQCYLSCVEISVGGTAVISCSPVPRELGHQSVPNVYIFPFNYYYFFFNTAQSQCHRKSLPILGGTFLGSSCVTSTSFGMPPAWQLCNCIGYCMPTPGGRGQQEGRGLLSLDVLWGLFQKHLTACWVRRFALICRDHCVFSNLFHAEEFPKRLGWCCNRKTEDWECGSF